MFRAFHVNVLLYPDVELNILTQGYYNGSICCTFYPRRRLMGETLDYSRRGVSNPKVRFSSEKKRIKSMLTEYDSGHGLDTIPVAGK